VLAEQNVTSACGKGSLNLNTVDIALVALADISPELNAKVIAALQSEDKDAGLAEHLREEVPSLRIILGPGPAKRAYRLCRCIQANFDIHGFIAPPQGWHASKKHISLCFATNCLLSRGTIVSSKTILKFFANAFDSMSHPKIRLRLTRMFSRIDSVKQMFPVRITTLTYPVDL
jgi:hypothetical protein